jgi:hypothetical protein
VPATLRFDADVWLAPAEAAWHFVTLPPDAADEVRARTAGRARPFGSVPVAATIGATTWSTSVFADSTSGSFLLPLKADVRRRERIGEGDRVSVRLELRG